MKTISRNIRKYQVLNSMDMHPKKIVFELTEHDASRLLRLIKRELNQEDEVWQPYWQRLANNLENSIQEASRSIFQRLKDLGLDQRD